MRLFSNLSPFSFEGEGEEIYREGFHPSLTYTGALNSLPLLREGGQGDRLLNNLILRLVIVCYNP